MTGDLKPVVASQGKRRIAIAANDAWNILNYRTGLIRALQRAGFEVTILVPHGKLAGQVTALGVKLCGLQMSRRGVSPAEDSVVLLNFVRQLKRIRPSALLTFTIKPNIYGSIAARICGIPVINNVSGLGTVFSKKNALTRLVTNLYRFGFKRSKVVFFQNATDVQLFLDAGIVTEGQVRRVPGSGVDLDRFTPRGRKPDHSGFRFLLFARLLWAKGLQEFVDAARRLKSDWPDARFQILGIVESPGADAVPIAEVEQWQAEGMVEFLPSVDDVRPVLAEADCVVLPSFYGEGVPRSLLEAAAMGLPTITTATPGCRDAVDDGTTGLLCQPRSSESLAQAMEQMLRMPAEDRISMGAAGRAKMEREFAEQIVLERYLAALHDLGISSGTQERPKPARQVRSGA